MREQLIILETAKLAKDKGFNIPVLGVLSENGEYGDNEDLIFLDYNKFPTTKGSSHNLYSAPTQSLLQKWLREKHKIFIDITLQSYNYNNHDYAVFDIKDKSNFKEGIAATFEEALEKSLIKALQFINIK